MDKKKFLITYDITSDKSRNKVSDLLEKYGVRIQYSVFESRIKVKELKQLLKKIEKIVNSRSDSVIVYQICKECYDKKIQIGKNYIFKNLEILIE